MDNNDRRADSPSGTAEAQTDGGQPRDPRDDPAACSKCGVHIGAFGGEYCDPCARELGEKPPIERCLNCTTRAPRPQMTAIDISTEDELYPEMQYLCRECASDDDSDDPEIITDGGHDHPPEAAAKGAAGQLDRLSVDQRATEGQQTVARHLAVVCRELATSITLVRDLRAAAGENSVAPDGGDRDE